MAAPFPFRFLPVAAAIALPSCQAPAPPPAAAKPQTAAETKAAPGKPQRLRPSERGEISSISLEKTFELQQSGGALICDARPSVHYRAGHIAGAINIPKSIAEDVIGARQSELKSAKASGKSIIVYCSGPLCADSRAVARHLASRGYSSSVFSGGWDAWNAADLPKE